VTADDSYSVVHLVVTETMNRLIGPQVVDHMAVQATSPGPGRPARTAVVLIDAARRVMTAPYRRRVQELNERSPDVPVVLLPYVGRLGSRANARLLVGRIRKLVGNGPVVFHCRGEAPVSWARDLAPYFPRAGIVADIRGAWPEERLFERGESSPETASSDARQEYAATMDSLLATVGPVSELLTVSRPMMSWIREVGLEGRVTYVPCCVTGVTYDPKVRADTRARLGLSDRLVFIYSGTVLGYQHLEDGALPFFAEVTAQASDAFLIFATGQRKEAEQLVAASGLPPDRVAVMSLPQHEVPSVLTAADAGLLLRAPSRLNRLSQPTKLAEYLAAGVPVIASRGMGCVDSIVEENGAGCAVDWFGRSAFEQRTEVSEVLASLREKGAAMRKAALTLCEREFRWSRYVDDVRRAYTRALAAGVREARVTSYAS
jgi:glycosyltransferase involved in cell wall biosynthesis